MQPDEDVNSSDDWNRALVYKVTFLSSLADTGTPTIQISAAMAPRGTMLRVRSWGGSSIEAKQSFF